jgi:Ca-activated chloride channel family protein
MPAFEYSEWDGTQRFQPLAAEAVFDKFSEYLLEYGEYILRRLDQIDPDDADVLKLLVKEGYLEQDETGQFRVAAKGVRRLEEKALHELFLAPQKDTLGKHETDHKGAGQVVHEDSKPYEYGDPVANLNLHETLKNALIRQGGGTPIHVSEEDFVVYETEFQTSCATVLLLDIRGRYPEDSLQTIGFYTYASPLSARDVVRAAPKPVSLFDSRVFLRVPLDQAREGVPEHFTNIQAGLRFARHVLHRQPARNKQIICVTDGEPTAHLEGRDLVLIYPPSERTARATLEEVRRCTSEGIQLSTFALIEDYFYLGLVNFVDQMARLSRGLAVYCTAGQLGHYVLDSFVHGHRSRKHVG